MPSAEGGAGDAHGGQSQGGKKQNVGQTNDKPNKPEFDYQQFWAEMRTIGEGVSALQITSARLDTTTAKLEKLSEETCLKVTDVRERLERVETTAAKAEDIAVTVQSQFRTLKDEVAEIRSQMAAMYMRRKDNQLSAMRMNVEKLEGYSRRFNLVFDGFEETADETEEKLRQKLTSFIRRILAISDVNFDIAHRLGPKGMPNRKVIAKFTSLRDEVKIFAARSVLQNPKNSAYKIMLDKPKGVKDREAMAFKIVWAAQRTGRYRSVRFHHGRVWLDDVSFEYEDFDQLTYDLTPAAIASPRTKEVVVFYSHHSPLSNHHPAPFCYNGEYFAHMEQYLAYTRAKVAEDRIMMRKVLLTDDPVDHSRFLRQMKEDGKEGRWADVLISYVDAGLIEKFRQNAKPRDFLLNTEARVIGEASVNPFWGIGMTLNDRNVFNQQTWSKEGNVLGRALMGVRSAIMRAEAQ